MTRRFWLGCGVVATVLSLAGCAVPCHKGYQKSLEHAAECELPASCRNRVYLFMFHGVTPSTGHGLNALRLKLGDNGFAHVGIGEMCHYWWVKDEIECIRKNEPDARFVLLGYDYGAPIALTLARELKEKCIPVETVVLLDPMGCGPEPCGVNTLLVATGKCTATVPHSARVVVPDATHFGLPAHATTVAVVTDLLRNVAAHAYEPEIEEIPMWTYPHAPEARPVSSGELAGTEWDFLSDRPGPARALGTQTIARPIVKSPAVVATPAVPVAVKR